MEHLSDQTPEAGFSSTPEQKSPLIITYANLLHQFGNPHAQEVLNFVESHKDDPIFLRRVKTLNAMFALK